VKKVRLEIQKKSEGRQVWLFPTASELYEWIERCYDDPHEAVSGTPEPAAELILRPGDFMEVEWWGCEVLHEGDGQWRHLNLVRLGLGKQSDNAAGLIVSVHVGWVIDTIVPFYDYHDENILVTRIDNKEPKLDLDELFKQEGVEM